MPKRSLPQFQGYDSITPREKREILTSSDSPASLEIDSTTGMIVAVHVDHGKRTEHQEIHMSLEVIVGGKEVRDPTGGLTYENTETLIMSSVESKTQGVHKGSYYEFNKVGNIQNIDCVFHYRIYPTSPYVELAVTLSAHASTLVRNIAVSIVLPDCDNHLLNIPGNMIRRNLLFSFLGEQPLGVSPIGGLRGSSGIVSVTGAGRTVTLWPNNPNEISDIVVRKDHGNLVMGLSMNFAAEISPENHAEVLLVTMDLGLGDFENIKASWPAWASRYQLTSPGNPPLWMHGAGMYEAQIGTSYFWGGNSYTRYNQIRDLIADLDRIQQLGFSVIQLMPRQPYPSYNVHDYNDITVSYGDEQELRDLVSDCHRRNMRVILDVLLHGVLDNESIDMAVEGVKNGPLYNRLHEPVRDAFGSDVSDPSNYLIAWSRHIMDFSDAWRSGSPSRTPLQDSHPEWFATDSEGRVSGVYTKAFDARHPEWQRYFREAMLELLRRTDADGFRFDAPTYNFFANWAPWARKRAFMSPLGCVPLFVDLRQDIKRLKPDALMYTEPSGHLLRRSMDVNYNYDEQWLVTSLLSSENPLDRGVRNGKEFMEWMEDRDRFLPLGSHTAHHIDSHDTFWWPEWGKKWRREQYSLQAVRAITAAFLAIDGPYMMFTGGEEGIEDLLSTILSFRKKHHTLWSKPVHFGTHASDDTQANTSDNLVIAFREDDSFQLLCVINLSSKESEILPVDVTDGWNLVFRSGIEKDNIAPYGILFCEKEK